MSSKFPMRAKVLLGLGVILFAASFYPNYVLDNSRVGDLLEMLGTGSLVVGACISVNALLRNVFVTPFLYTGSACLVLARLCGCETVDDDL